MKKTEEVSAIIQRRTLASLVTGCAERIPLSASTTEHVVTALHNAIKKSR